MFFIDDNVRGGDTLEVVVVAEMKVGVESGDGLVRDAETEADSDTLMVTGAGDCQQVTTQQNRIQQSLSLLIAPKPTSLMLITP